ncbi:hypothetical protein ADEAN_000281400 [Angomonas deanei]|uniref:Uncharacterized protein n=1 Tax=Angomonas deanei TaxID=59799 RepID=A0A7G2C6Y9_9TRYP|nr:hypothetical protein ADEAN_000281400 [Angomonas deanei]
MASQEDAFGRHLILPSLCQSYYDQNTQQPGTLKSNAKSYLQQSAKRGTVATRSQEGGFGDRTAARPDYQKRPLQASKEERFPTRHVMPTWKSEAKVYSHLSNSSDKFRYIEDLSRYMESEEGEEFDCFRDPLQRRRELVKNEQYTPRNVIMKNDVDPRNIREVADVSPDRGNTSLNDARLGGGETVDVKPYALRSQKSSPSRPYEPVKNDLTETFVVKMESQRPTKGLYFPM